MKVVKAAHSRALLHTTTANLRVLFSETQVHGLGAVFCLNFAWLAAARHFRQLKMGQRRECLPVGHVSHGVRGKDSIRETLLHVHLLERLLEGLHFIFI